MAEPAPRAAAAPRPVTDRPVLLARGLCRSFASGDSVVRAVAGADLSVDEGELLVVLGRSGAGKTTLLTLCGGLDRPDSGSVTVGGRDVAGLRGAARDLFLQRTVGWVFQAPGLLPLLSAEENVALGLRLAGSSEAEAAAMARRALAGVGLSGRARHRGNELSGGEQHRVALARALAKAPALLIADEPTSQLDTETARGILALIREAADSGTAVLLATHDRAAAEVAD
ncbi:MAG: ABC transporter ATP-binding protein, partial [Candidatus Dormibacteraeota bacterium]|nr:ABC transporter ATP-binding protein [Candidatus Dormibacteraeota bacterium]